jgi:uncharacterized protein YhbP (UPF0306 family)
MRAILAEKNDNNIVFKENYYLFAENGVKLIKITENWLKLVKIAQNSDPIIDPPIIFVL